eukprot:scaffold21051_cov111-Isochrysis_galbana.AAC.4
MVRIASASCNDFTALRTVGAAFFVVDNTSTIPSSLRCEHVVHLVGDVFELGRLIANALEALHNFVQRGGVAIGNLDRDSLVEPVDICRQIRELLLHRVEHDRLERREVEHVHELDGVAHGALGQRDDLHAAEARAARQGNVLGNLSRVQACPHHSLSVQHVHVIEGRLAIGGEAAVHEGLPVNHLHKEPSARRRGGARELPSEAPIREGLGGVRPDHRQREQLRHTGRLERCQLAIAQADEVWLCVCRLREHLCRPCGRGQVEDIDHVGRSLFLRHLSDSGFDTLLRGRFRLRLIGRSWRGLRLGLDPIVGHPLVLYVRKDLARCGIAVQTQVALETRGRAGGRLLLPHAREGHGARKAADIRGDRIRVVGVLVDLELHLVLASSGD